MFQIERKVRDRENRITLADWVTTVFSIFWSVWWGFFMNAIFNDKSKQIIIYINSNLVLNIHREFYLLINVLWICLFCFFYVRWLWSVHRTAISVTFIRDFLIYFLPLSCSTAGMLSSVVMMYYANIISPYIITYGVLITLSWYLIVIISLWGPY